MEVKVEVVMRYKPFMIFLYFRVYHKYTAEILENFKPSKYYLQAMIIFQYLFYQICLLNYFIPLK